MGNRPTKDIIYNNKKYYIQKKVGKEEKGQRTDRTNRRHIIKW